MSTLADYQREVRDLIKGRNVHAPEDPHLAAVAGSPGLAAIRKIAVWWRSFGVENYCVFTSQVLKRAGIFDSSVEEFYRSQNVSPYIEKAGELFLVLLSAHPDPLVAEMAQLELALLKVRRGDPGEFQLDWDRNPDAVFHALATKTDLPRAEAGCAYKLTVSGAIPGLVHCECVER